MGGGGAPSVRKTKDVYVVGGQDERRLISLNGQAWSHDIYVASNGQDNAFTSFSIGGGLIVAVGDPGVWTSPDGITWTHQTAAPVNRRFHAAVAIYANNQYIFAAGSSAFRSADGIAWTEATNTGDAGHWHALTFGAGKLVAVGDDCRKVSEDGLNWHDYVKGDGNFNGVTFGDGKFVAVGTAGLHAVSTDGINWNKVQNDPLFSGEGDLGSVAFGKGVFVATNCCKAFTSPDGVTWTAKGSGINGQILFGNGLFVGAGWRAAIKTSSDGTQFDSVLDNSNEKSLFDMNVESPWFTAIGYGKIWAN